MPDWDDFQIPPEQLQLQGILMKVVAYQFSLPDDRRTPKGFHHSAQGCGGLRGATLGNRPGKSHQPCRG